MSKVEKFVKCGDFNVAVIGKGKNARLLFIDRDFVYADDHFDAPEVPIKPGINANLIDEWLLTMTMKDFRKIAKELL